MNKLAPCFSVRSFYCFSFQALSQSCVHRKHSTIKNTLFKKAICSKSKHSEMSKSWHFSSLLQTSGSPQKESVFASLALHDIINTCFPCSGVASWPRSTVSTGTAWLQGKDWHPGGWGGHTPRHCAWQSGSAWILEPNYSLQVLAPLFTLTWPWARYSAPPCLC